jgi:hypothetical protein
MKTIVGVLIVGAMACSTALAVVQPGPARQGRGGWGPNGPYGRLYDPKTVETVRGRIVAVERVFPMRGMSAGVHVRLRTTAGVLDIHLGPAWFIDNQEITLKNGEDIEVRGSRVVVAGGPAIIAAEVTRGDDVLHLRDELGFPAWSGWRRRTGT